MAVVECVGCELGGAVGILCCSYWVFFIMQRLISCIYSHHLFPSCNRAYCWITSLILFLGGHRRVSPERTVLLSALKPLANAWFAQQANGLGPLHLLLARIASLAPGRLLPALLPSPLASCAWTVSIFFKTEWLLFFPLFCFYVSATCPMKPHDQYLFGCLAEQTHE